jgi:hypothetical protein
MWSEQAIVTSARRIDVFMANSEIRSVEKLMGPLIFASLRGKKFQCQHAG